MSITPQLPPIPLAQASAMLRAMVQGSGTQVEGRVIGALPNGATQVQIGRQVMSLQLPAPQMPGTVLILAAEQAEGQLRMTLVATRPASAPPATPNMPAAPGSGPAASVQLSPAALAGTQAPAASSAPAATVPPVPPASAAAPMAQISPTAGRPAIPYPMGAASPAMPLPAAISGAATTALPAVPQSAGSAPAGQHSAPAAGPAVHGGTANAATAPAPAPAPPSPQAELTQMVQQALTRQGSVVSLTQALTQALGRMALPEPVMKAAQQVLAQQLPLDDGPPSAASLRKAIRASGIFQEAMLAAGLSKGGAGDMKSALLGLQRQLAAWLGDQKPVEPARPIPPPLRGAVPRARADTLPPGPLPDDPQLAGRILLDRTEAALSRLRLHQHASLPEPAARQEAQWSLDLPIVLGGQQSLLHMHIHRDRDAEPAQEAERGWQLRFAINLSEIGEVGAQIALRGGSAGILLWAEREETASALAEGVAALREDLEALGLRAGAIVVRNGAPGPLPGSAKASGHIVDAVR